jgi:hypothetical protein
MFMAGAFPESLSIARTLESLLGGAAARQFRPTWTREIVDSRKAEPSA